jgi:type IV pilus assembly protein PilB
MLRTYSGRVRIGEILVDQGMVTQEQLSEVMKQPRPSGVLLGTFLVERGLITSTDLYRCLAIQYHLPFIDLHEYPVNIDALRYLSEEQAFRYKMFPIEIHRDTIVITMADPSSTIILDDLKIRLKKEIIPTISSRDEIEAAIKYYMGSSFADESSDQDFGDLISDLADEEEIEVVEETEEIGEDKEAETAPVIKMVNAIITEAIKRRASDIHIDCREKDIRLRFRVDGVLYGMKPPPKRMQNALISRIKIMSELDISERRNPQDGHFRMKYGDNIVDFRVATLPTVFGEKVVMRLLDKGNLRLDMSKLGLETESYDMFKRAVKRPYGMLLVTGPTGSGKSTTLYSALNSIATPDVNVITCEDPVEYNLPEINQVAIRPEQGLTFPKALKSILRQDPDIIMIGEIRDHETAEIAVKAALTGHLVLSTLHTNDAPSTLTRLIDMGLEPFLVTASVILIVAQRLLRKICPNCKEQYEPSDDTLQLLGLWKDIQNGVPRPAFYKGIGCRTCGDTGYSGRIALYEIMEMNEELRRMILEGKNADQIKKRSVECGMLSLRASGIRKILDGVTTVDEVVRVTFED